LTLVSHVMALYERIDSAVAEFQLKSGLRCPSGCGRCCPTAKVQATLLEMLPAAHEILVRGSAADCLERLADRPVDGACAFYTPQPQPDASGHCTFYQWRPALCRLFGYAAVRDRTGGRALSVCRRIKQTDPQAVAAAMPMADAAPCFVHFGAQVFALDPVLGNRPMPINAALRQAIERLGLGIAFAYTETLRDHSAA